MYVYDVIPNNISIIMSKLGRHHGLFILAFHVYSCEIQCKSLDNTHEFSQIIYCWKEDELLC